MCSYKDYKDSSLRYRVIPSYHFFHRKINTHLNFLESILKNNSINTKRNQN